LSSPTSEDQIKEDHTQDDSHSLTEKTEPQTYGKDDDNDDDDDLLQLKNDKLLSNAAKEVLEELKPDEEMSSPSGMFFSI
jgi:hypothetical protein